MFELVANPGAGWGDPLDRDPRLVEHDLTEARVREYELDALYGVIPGDAAATIERRAARRADRLAAARPPREPLAGQAAGAETAPQLVEGVAIVGPHLACAACARLLGTTEQAYRLGCCELDVDFSAISELLTPATRETSETLVFRQYLCPSCGRGIDGQVCRPTDPTYRDAYLLT